MTQCLYIILDDHRVPKNHSGFGIVQGLGLFGTHRGAHKVRGTVSVLVLPHRYRHKSLALHKGFDGLPMHR
jgi:hypothetical protein